MLSPSDMRRLWPISIEKQSVSNRPAFFCRLRQETTTDDSGWAQPRVTMHTKCLPAGAGLKPAHASMAKQAHVCTRNRKHSRKYWIMNRKKRPKVHRQLWLLQNTPEGQRGFFCSRCGTFSIAILGNAAQANSVRYVCPHFGLLCLFVCVAFFVVSHSHSPYSSDFG